MEGKNGLVLLLLIRAGEGSVDCCCAVLGDSGSEKETAQRKSASGALNTDIWICL